MRRRVGVSLSISAGVVAAMLAADAAAGYSIVVSGTAPNKVLTVTSDGASGVRVTNVLMEHIKVDPIEGMSEPFTTTGCEVGQTESAYCGPVADFSKVVFAGGDGNDGFIAELVGPAPPGETPTVIRIRVEARGDGGDDSLSSLAGEDRLEGGPGDDWLSAGPAPDHLLGGSGRDQLLGGDGDDLLDGGAGTDTINGNDDYLFFPPGPLYVAPSAVDTVDYSDRAAAVNIDINDVVFVGAPQNNSGGTGGEVGENDALWSVERALGGEGDDVLMGSSSRADVLEGASGDDTIDGRSGDDALFGEDGDDDLTGGPGRDSLDGGPGDDFLDAFDSAVDAILQCGPGTDDKLFADNTLDLAGASDCETVAPEFETAPRVTGDPRPGATLAYGGALISGSAHTLGYQWLRCRADCEDVVSIDGATAASYVVGPGDAGAALILMVSAANSAGGDEAFSDPLPIPAPSAPALVIPPSPAPPATSDPPAITPPPLPSIASVRRPRVTRTRRGFSVDTGRRASCTAGTEPCTVSTLAKFRRGKVKTILAGRRTVVLAPGQTSRMTFRLSRSAAIKLRSSGRLRLSVAFTAKRGTLPAQTTNATLTIRRQPAPGK